MKIKNICCIGAGYVGGPTMSIIAQKNPTIMVNVVDMNSDKIAAWNSKNLENLPVYEPGLSKIVKATRGKNLFFSTDIEKHINDADMIFISVNTPTKTDGEGKGYAADLKYVKACAKQIAKVAKTDKIIVEKSTVPVRTSEMIRSILIEYNSRVDFQILSNPEFLAEGTAMRDLEVPDRVLIGGEDSSEGRKAIKSLVDIYSKWVPKENILTTNLWSSELSKLCANAFLAQRISSINSLSELCEETGADIEEVSRAIGMDNRIGSSFLKTSVGFGGSCFQKDILNLVYIARSLKLNKVADYWEQILIINNHQRNRFSEKIINCINKNNLKDKILLLGWSFKKNTNDSRESAAIYVSKNLLSNGIKIDIYDPRVDKNQIINDLNLLNTKFEINSINVVKNPLKNISKYNLIAIATEWDEFIDYDWKDIFNKIKKPAFIFDGRNLLDKDEIKMIGFNYYSLGR
jgi:UDPglucose 6-dehydrogenase